MLTKSELVGRALGLGELAAVSRDLTYELCAYGPRDTPAMWKTVFDWIARMEWADRYLGGPPLVDTNIEYYVDNYLYFHGYLPASILVMAHIDTVPGTVGAEDNASGVVGLMHFMTRYIRDRMEGKEVPGIDFLFTTREESPYFGTERMGSFKFFQEHPPESYGLIVNLDCIGFSGKGPAPNGYALVSNQHFWEDYKSTAKVILSQGLTLFGVHSEDNLLTLSDTRWAYDRTLTMHVHDSSVYGENFFHFPEDTPDKLDYIKMTRLVETTYNSIRKAYYE